MMSDRHTTPQMKPVFSSHVDQIGYDDKNNTLHVLYKNGARVTYDGVGPDKAKQVMSAASIGEALHGLIRGQHKHSYLSE